MYLYSQDQGQDYFGFVVSGFEFCASEKVVLFSCVAACFPGMNLLLPKVEYRCI